MITVENILKLENDFANDPEVQRLTSLLQSIMNKKIDEAGVQYSDETEQAWVAWDEFHSEERYLDLDEVSMFRFLLRY